MNKPIFLLGLVLVVLVAVGLSIGVAVAKESKEDKKAAKQEKKCDKLEKKNDKREAKGKDIKPLPDYCEAPFEGQVFEFPTLGVTVTVQAPAPVTVTAVPTTDPTIIDPNRDGTFGGLNQFYSFEADGPFTLAKIESNYNPALLTNYVDEATLTLNFWDNTINDWAQPLDSGIDTANHVVWAIVDHFSEWAPIADALGQYSNNFELGRASKPNVPLGIYIKKSYVSYNADDVDVAPYDLLSLDDFGGTSMQSLKFDGPAMRPTENSDYVWLETGIFDVNESTTYTFSFDVKYLPSEAGSPDYGFIYYYEIDLDGNFVRTADLIAFTADTAWAQRDWITVTSEPIQGKSGWQRITATLETDGGVTQAKIAFMEANTGAGRDSYLVDDFTYAAV